MSDDVTIQIIDGAGAAVVVPLSSVQLVIGTAVKGTPGQVIATKSPSTLRSVFKSGQLVEYCSNVVAAGSTVLAILAAVVTPGYLNGDAVNSHGGTTPTMSAATDVNGVLIEITATAHGLKTGQVVLIAGTGGQTLANGLWPITRTGADTFTIPVNGDGAHAYSSPGTIKTTGVWVNPISPASPRLPGLGSFTQSTSVALRPSPGIALGGPLVSAVGKTVVTVFPHDLSNGDTVTLSGVTTNTTINGSQVVTVVDDYTFTVPVGSGTGGVTDALFTGPRGAYDDLYVVIAVVNDSNSGNGKQVGTSGLLYRLSLDAGRNFGPVTALGTNKWINLTGTGVCVHLSNNALNGYLYTGDVIIFSTVAMAAAVSNASPLHGIVQCLGAAAASSYAVAGWGSTKILGVWTAANVATLAADTTGTIDSIAALYDVFTRGMFDARDASPPVIWGGTGETETTWMSDGSVGIVNTFATLGAKRALVAGGYYNIPSAVAGVAGAPSYRRPGGWAQGIRQTLIPPQRHSGRVKDGAVGIVIDTANDPLDGFIYHDERSNPALDAARFCSFTTRKGKPGFFVKNPNLMSAAGSNFTILPLGNVMDVACDIVHQVGEDEINDDLRLTATGTLVDKDAAVLEGQFDRALTEQMVNKSMLSSESTSVDRANNVRTTKEVNVEVTIGSRGYVLKENITIGFSTP